MVVQTVVTHQNCRSGQLEEMAKFAQMNGYSLDVMVARAIGAWEGRHDILVDEADSAYMWELHQRYPVLHRDTFPSYGMDKGCGCVDATLHLTQYGDILPCVFIHIGIGNISRKAWRISSGAEEHPAFCVLQQALPVRGGSEFHRKVHDQILWEAAAAGLAGGIYGRRFYLMIRYTELKNTGRRNLRRYCRWRNLLLC